MAHLGGRADELAERIARAGVSLTFEVISRRDPHIIDEGDDKVVLLDAIRNQEEAVLLDELRRGVAEDFGFVSPPVEVLSPAADDDALTALAQRARRAEEDREEGFVITYADGAMTKYKSDYYRGIRAFRSLLTRHLAGGPVRMAGPGADLMRAFLDHGTTEGFMVEGLLGPVVNIPALVASL